MANPSTRTPFFGLLLILISIGCAPKVNTLELNPDVTFPMRGSGSENELEHFFPLPEDTTGIGAIFVARVTKTFDFSKSSSSDLGYGLFRMRAGYFQANHYRVETPKCTRSNNPCEVVLGLFRTKETFIPSRDTTLSNAYIIFGPKVSVNSSYLSFTLDSLQIELDPFKYWMFRNTRLRPMVLNSGGNLMGTTITLGTKSQPVQYLQVAGTGARPGISPTGGVGVSISRGSFQPVSQELAIYLLQLLERQVEPVVSVD